MLVNFRLQNAPVLSAARHKPAEPIYDDWQALPSDCKKYRMAHQKRISNRQTGQDIIFLQTGADTNGTLLEMEATYSGKSKEPIAHYHPFQEEWFTVLQGELTLRINENLTVLKEGSTIHIPAAQAHAMWNSREEKAVVNWKVRPALDTESFLKTFTGFANDGKTNAKGVPDILQLSLTAMKFSNVVRLTKPVYPVQVLIFALIRPIAYLIGLRATYRKYL